MTDSFREHYEIARTLEKDSAPDGWPVVQMKTVTALCDKLDELGKFHDDLARLLVAAEGESLIEIVERIIAQRDKLKNAKAVEPTDDFRTEVPLAFLVKCLPSCATCEYKVFTQASDAIRCAHSNGIEAECDWGVYPLYAGHPLLSHEIDKLNSWV
jgi:hypothetical protein